jgi:hypothetical protein
VESSGTFTLAGGGADVWGTADAFRYAYLPITGDATIVARVATIAGTQPWTKVGVMIRESLAPGSPHAFMLVSAGKGIAFQRRPSAGALSVHTAAAPGTAPRWVRLTRTGAVIAAAWSADGVTWTTTASQTIPMASAVLAGIAVSSHDPAQLATATFDDVRIVD